MGEWNDIIGVLLELHTKHEFGNSGRFDQGVFISNIYNEGHIYKPDLIEKLYGSSIEEYNLNLSL